MTTLLELENQTLTNTVGVWSSRVDDLKRQTVQLLTGVQTAVNEEGDEEADVLTDLALLVAQLDVPMGMDAAARRGMNQASAFGALEFEEQTGDQVPEGIRTDRDSLKASEGLDEGAQVAQIAALTGLALLAGVSRRSLPTSALSVVASPLGAAAKLSGGASVAAVRTAIMRAVSALPSPTKLVGTAAMRMTTALQALGPVLSHPAKVVRSVVWGINNASNSAISRIARRRGRTVTWIAERDACVNCLAYAGKRDTGDGFPEGLTFGKEPLKTDGMPHPPLHPHCRCSLDADASEEYAESLEREAVRSILRGFKMPSESEKVRLDAAARLLDKDPVAPKSVKAYAKRAIKKGEFPRGTDFPD